MYEFIMNEAESPFAALSRKRGTVRITFSTESLLQTGTQIRFVCAKDCTA